MASDFVPQFAGVNERTSGKKIYLHFGIKIGFKEAFRKILAYATVLF